MNKVFLIIGMSFILLFVGFSAVDIAEANDVIYACKHKDEGMVRIVDDHSYCRTSEVPVTLSQPGLFDPNNLYSNRCEDASTCPCDNDDILINGGAACNNPYEILWNSLPRTVSDPDGNSFPLNSWQAICYDGTKTTEPLGIWITCLRLQ